MPSGEAPKISRVRLAEASVRRLSVAASRARLRNTNAVGTSTTAVPMAPTSNAWIGLKVSITGQSLRLMTDQAKPPIARMRDFSGQISRGPSRFKLNGDPQQVINARLPAGQVGKRIDHRPGPGFRFQRTARR